MSIMSVSHYNEDESTGNVTKMSVMSVSLYIENTGNVTKMTIMTVMQQTTGSTGNVTELSTEETTTPSPVTTLLSPTPTNPYDPSCPTSSFCRREKGYCVWNTTENNCVAGHTQIGMCLTGCICCKDPGNNGSCK